MEPFTPNIRERCKRTHDDMMTSPANEHETEETTLVTKRPCVEARHTAPSSFWYTGTLLAQVSSYLHHPQDLLQWRLLLPSAAQRLWLNNVTNFSLSIPHWPTDMNYNNQSLAFLRASSDSNNDSSVDDLTSKYRDSIVYIMTVDCIERFVRYWWPCMSQLRQLNIIGFAIHPDDIVPLIMPIIQQLDKQLTHLTLRPSSKMNIVYKQFLNAHNFGSAVPLTLKSTPRKRKPDVYAKPVLAALTHLSYAHTLNSFPLHQWFSSPQLQDLTIYCHSTLGISDLPNQLQFDPSSITSLSLVPISTLQNNPKYITYNIVESSTITTGLHQYTGLKQCFIGFGVGNSTLLRSSNDNPPHYLPPCAAALTIFDVTLLRHLYATTTPIQSLTRLTLTCATPDRVIHSLRLLDNIQLPNLHTLVWPFYCDEWLYNNVADHHFLFRIRMPMMHAFESVWPNVRELSPNFRFIPFMWPWIRNNQNNIRFLDACMYGQSLGDVTHQCVNNSNRNVIYVDAENDLDLVALLGSAVTLEQTATYNNPLKVALPILKHLVIYNLQSIVDVLTAFSEYPNLWSCMQSLYIVIDDEKSINARDLMASLNFNIAQESSCFDHAPMVPNLRAFGINNPIVYDTTDEATQLLNGLLAWLPSNLQHMHLSMKPSTSLHEQLMMTTANQEFEVLKDLYYDGYVIPTLHWNTLARKFPKLANIILGGSISVQGVDLTINKAESHLQQDLLPMPHLQSFLFNHCATMGHPTKASHLQWLIDQLTTHRARIMPLIMDGKGGMHPSLTMTPMYTDEGDFVPYGVLWYWHLAHRDASPYFLSSKDYRTVSVWSFCHPNSDTFINHKAMKGRVQDDISPCRMTINLYPIGRSLNYDKSMIYLSSEYGMCSREHGHEDEEMVTLQLLSKK